MELLQYGAAAALPGWLMLALTTTLLLAPVFAALPLWAVALTWSVTAWTFGWPVWLMVLLGAPLTVLLVPPLRRALLSDRILALLVKAGLLPSISDTEREAIDAGTVWLDGEWFSGRPSLLSLIHI